MSGSLGNQRPNAPASTPSGTYQSLVPEGFAGSHKTGVPDREPIRARKVEIKPLVIQVGTARLIQHETTGEPSAVLGCITARLAFEADDLVTSLVPWQRHERRSALGSGELHGSHPSLAPADLL